MFLNNKEDVINWFLENSYFDSIIEIKNMIDFENTIDNNLIINIKENIMLMLKDDIKELQIQFGTINGNFSLYGKAINNFKGFPTIIKGNLEASGNSFKSTNEWNIKEIDGLINLCSKNCELENLNFLKNTKFEKFYIQVSNTPFKDNIIPEDLQNEIYYDKEDDSTILSYNNFNIYLENQKKESNEIDKYLNFFDNELEKEIK